MSEASPAQLLHSGEGGAWLPAEPGVRFPEGALDVWLADLGAAADPPRDLLSADELARARRFSREQHGRTWARARGILRLLLGGYSGRDPRTLEFAAGPRGKPFLVGGETRFNLSHSGELALFAFSAVEEVGVDVEVERARTDVEALAARAFGEQEAARLSMLAPEQRGREFLRSWVRHEARLKQTGAGIASPPEPAPAAWSADLDLGPRAAGAVAVARAPRELRLWRLAG